MYKLTLEINKICNLRCRYCYLGDKTNDIMSMEIAKKSIEWAIKEATKMNEKVLKINFLGGEPLATENLISDIVLFCEKIIDSYKIKIIYSITTNGTLLNEKNIDFFIKNDFDLKISIDGGKMINDINRTDASGNGSFKIVHSKFGLLNTYENRTQKCIQITNVVTKNNYQYLAKSLSDIVNMGFRYIDTAFDSNSKWELRELNILEKQILQSIDYCKKIKKKDERFRWSFIDSIENIKKKCKRVYGCGAGIVMVYVCSQGEVYPCPTCFDTKLSIGNIAQKIDNTYCIDLYNQGNLSNSKCLKCEYYNYCKPKGCYMKNYLSNNNFKYPDEFECWLVKLKHRIYADCTYHK